MPSPPAPSTRIGTDTTVTWLDGGVLVQWQDHGFLLDAPPGITRALGPRIASVRAIVLTGGRWQSVGGLIELLAQLGPYRSGLPMDLRLPLGAERGVALAETWIRAWGSPYPLAIDLVRPGIGHDMGPMGVELRTVRSAEPDGTGEGIVPRLQVATRLTTPDAVVVWVPAAAPGEGVRKLCVGADLAIVEAGTRPWPAHEGRWRMTPTEALTHGSGAGEAWVVGDDGLLLDHQFPTA